MPTIDFNIPTSTTIVQSGGLINNLNDAAITVTWNNNTGAQTKIVKEGSLNDIIPLLTLCRQQGYSYSISNGEVFRLEIDLPFDFYMENESSPSISGMIWDLSFQPYEKFIYNCVDRPFINVLSPSFKQNIDNTLREVNQSNVVFPKLSSDVPFFTQGNIAYRLRQISNDEGKQAFVPVLKRSFIMRGNASVPYPTNAAFESPDYDNTIFCTPTMLTIHNATSPLNKIPVSISSIMPVSLDLIDQYGNPNFVYGWNMDNRGIVTYTGWRQLPVEVHTLSYGKQQITRQWVFNAWSAGSFGLYDVAIGNGLSEIPDRYTLTDLQSVVNQPG